MKAIMGTKIEKLQRRFGLYGVSEEIKETARLIEQVGPTDITVLIHGESGTGKEIVAKAIHGVSNRSEKPLVIVNSGAIPDGLIESELFGHTKGAFTGAVSERKGYFEEADGGTIFLDEVGEMPLQIQVKLLRILEQGEFQRVGSSESRKVEVRVIAATNKELAKLINEGNFRRDLFYRLRAITINIPPLRKRKEDIPILTQIFADKYAEKLNITFGGFAEDALDALQSYNWHGNVRELKNFIESLIVIEKGRVITKTVLRKHLNLQEIEKYLPNPNLPVHVDRSVEQAERELILRNLFLLRKELGEVKGLLFSRLMIPSALSEEGDIPVGFTKAVEEASVVLSDREIGDVSLQEMEKELIKGTLARYSGNRRKSSEALGLSERTLYRKIKEYDL